MKNTLLLAASLGMFGLSAPAGASGLTAERLPQYSPGFAAATPFPNRTVALDQVDSQYLFMEEMIFDRDIAAQVDDTINEMADFYDSLAGLEGRSLPTVADKFYHYEMGYIYRSVKVGTIVATSASSVTITLTGDSYSTVGSMLGAINRSPLKVTDEVMFAGRVWGYVTAKTGTGNTAQYTIVRRDNSTEDLGATVAGHKAANQAFGIPSNAQQQASGPPDEGMDTLPTRFEGTMQTFRNVTPRISGDADAAVMHVMINGQKRYYNKLALQAAMKQRMDIGFANMLSPGGSFTNGSGNLVQLSTGLEGYIMNLGQNYYYQIATGLGATQIREIVDKCKALSGTREFIWECGPSQRSDLDDFLTDRVSATHGLSYATFGIGDPKNRAIDLGFSTFKIFGLVFHLHEGRFFQHPEVTGLPGMNYDSCGFIIPGDSVTITSMKDGEFKRGAIKSLTARYKISSKGDSRRWREKEFDRQTNGDFDTFQWSVLSQEGFQMAGARRFIRVQGY